MTQPIQLNRTTGANPPPTPLLVGEAAVAVAPGFTRLWLGDGTNNRLLLTSNPTDTLGQGVVLANYLPLTGGTVTGTLELLTPPSNPDDAVNKEYVDDLLTNIQLYLGTWSVAANTPNISGGAGPGGGYYIATTVNPGVGESPPAGIPGLPTTMTINNGDFIFWNQALTVWQRVAGGALTVNDANQLYVQLAGSTMTGPLTLPGPPAATNQAATMGYVTSQLGAYLPLSGGVMTGGITFPGTFTPTNPGDAVTLTYLESALQGVVTSVTTDGTYIDGDGTSTDPITLILVDGGTF